MAIAETRPCEYCGKPVTRTKTQQSQRRYWTCGRACANGRRIQLGHTPQWGDNPLRGQQETRACAICGQPVTRYLTPRIAAREWWACSTTCAATMRTRERLAAGTWQRPNKPRRGDTVACLVCGKEFYRQPAYIKQDRRLCSRACNAAWQSRRAIEMSCTVCGKPTTVAPSQSGRRFCSLACRDQANTKRAIDRYHNGRPVIQDRDGYLWLYEPTHPNANRAGRVREHRYVASKRLGRPLRRDEEVDHINQDRADNRDENLQVLSRQAHRRKTTADQRRAKEQLLQRLADAETEAATLRAQLAALNGAADEGPPD